MIEGIAFALLSVGLLYISRASLRVPGSHGFYRFFAWEVILALIILNVDVWFKDPLSWHQLISWALLIASIAVLVLGVRALVARGKPVSQRQGEAQLLAFEKTSNLVTSGIYRYIRHPLYSSLLFLAWGAFFKTLDLTGALLALAATLLLVAAARADESECRRFFGAEYQDYMQRSKMFVPYIF